MKRIFFMTAFIFIMISGAVYAAGGNDIVNTGEKYIGYPYVYGSKGPSSFDCSGFVYYIYKQNGITVPSYSGSYIEWWNYGTKITDPAKLQNGDILCFGSSASSLSHVGIYDNGYILHALNDKYGVMKNPQLSVWMNSSSWNSNGQNQFQYAVRPYDLTAPMPSMSANVQKVSGGYTFNVNLKNIDRKAVLVTVLYKNGVQAEVKFTPVYAGESSKTVNVECENATWAKAFLWSSIDSMTPLVPVFSTAL